LSFSFSKDIYDVAKYLKKLQLCNHSNELHFKTVLGGNYYF